MLTNISNRTLDEGKLYSKIRNFESTHNQQAYLFMREETMKELGAFNNVRIFEGKDEVLVGGGIMCLYSGRKVYRDNDLKFGEVEIR